MNVVLSRHEKWQTCRTPLTTCVARNLLRNIAFRSRAMRPSGVSASCMSSFTLTGTATTARLNEPYHNKSLPCIPTSKQRWSRQYRQIVLCVTKLEFPLGEHNEQVGIRDNNFFEVDSGHYESMGSNAHESSPFWQSSFAFEKCKVL